MLMKNLIVLCMLIFSTAAWAQTKVGDKWVDNNLTIRITDDNIKSRGEFYICIADTSRGPCIQNLVTGVEVKIYNAADELLWEGIASGRVKGLKLPRPMPQASYLWIRTFKPYVVNKSTGNYIHQDERINVRYNIK